TFSYKGSIWIKLDIEKERRKNIFCVWITIMSKNALFFPSFDLILFACLPIEKARNTLFPTITVTESHPCIPGMSCCFMLPDSAVMTR
ncbi:hypothetical protein, partial [uncultured Faecalibaculum sp.]|uniref:hypothetical protein n=1 Tax=uncultured Faecalibaculum sp. TaxID=1729681 RepID=UPI002711E570